MRPFRISDWDPIDNPSQGIVCTVNEAASRCGAKPALAVVPSGTDPAMYDGEGACEAHCGRRLWQAGIDWREPT